MLVTNQILVKPIRKKLSKVKFDELTSHLIGEMKFVIPLIRRDIAVDYKPPPLIQLNQILHFDYDYLVEPSVKLSVLAQHVLTQVADEHQEEDRQSNHYKERYAAKTSQRNLEFNKATNDLFDLDESDFDIKIEDDLEKREQELVRLNQANFESIGTAKGSPGVQTRSQLASAMKSEMHVSNFGANVQPYLPPPVPSNEEDKINPDVNYAGFGAIDSQKALQADRKSLGDRKNHRGRPSKKKEKEIVKNKIKEMRKLKFTDKQIESFLQGQGLEIPINQLSPIPETEESSYNMVQGVKRSKITEGDDDVMVNMKDARNKSPYFNKSDTSQNVSLPNLSYLALESPAALSKTSTKKKK